MSCMQGQQLMAFPTDIIDVNREILLRLDSKSILNICITNKILYNICNDWLWRLKFSREYVDLGNIDYKKVYKIIEGNDANTLLLNAVRLNFADLIDVAIDRGADIHFDNDAALITASVIGNLSVVERLLDHGANINARDDGDPDNPDNDLYYNALISATSRNHIDIVRLLLDRGANIHAQGDQALTCASGDGYLDIMKLLLEQGADIHANGDDAILWAATKGKQDAVKLLITKGARGLDVAFVQAAAFKNTNVMQVLLDNGVHINVLGHAAIVTSTSLGHIEVIKFLINNGEDVNVHDGVLLYFAIDSGRLNIVQLLIEYGIEVNHEKIKKIEITDKNKEVINYLLR